MQNSNPIPTEAYRVIPASKRVAAAFGVSYPELCKAIDIGDCRFYKKEPDEAGRIRRTTCAAFIREWLQWQSEQVMKSTTPESRIFQ